jgi:hypothetical protein
MGFFDSLEKGYQKSYENETKNGAERQKNSRYKTLATIEREQLAELNGKSDGTLMREYNNALSSGDFEKSLQIEEILSKRGFSWNPEDDSFDRM